MINAPPKAQKQAIPQPYNPSILVKENKSAGAQQGVAAAAAQPPAPPNSPNKAPIDSYMAQVAVKHGLDAYDREQNDLIRPVEIPKQEQVVPGRDLKAERSKRSAVEIYDPNVALDGGKLMPAIDLNCLNDPFCEEKFSRNPVSDSLVDRDLTQFMKVGKRSLLRAQPDANITEGESRSL